jgi:hypothetical protein
MTDLLDNPAAIDWDNTDLLVEHFKIEVSRDYVGWSAYSRVFGADTATCHAPTKVDAIADLLEWLEGYIERRYGAMYDEAGFLP